MEHVLVLVAHGTRSAAGERTIDALARAVRRARPGRRVEQAYLEISPPSPAALLPAVRGPVVVVPLLLAGGYHAFVDLPGVVAEHRPDALVAPPLGPHALLTSALARRLARAGLRRADAVVLGAAGSSDPAGPAAARAAARLLAARLGRPVTAAFGSGDGPSVAEEVARVRRGPASRVAVASYLLAPGFFHDRLAASGADLVSEPLGADRDVVALVWRRFDETLRSATGYGTTPVARTGAGNGPRTTAGETSTAGYGVGATAGGTSAAGSGVRIMAGGPSAAGYETAAGETGAAGVGGRTAAGARA